jgi:hypothetical protein
MTFGRNAQAKQSFGTGVPKRSLGTSDERRSKSCGRVRNLEKRPDRESGDSVGSTPTSATVVHSLPRVDGTSRDGIFLFAPRATPRPVGDPHRLVGFGTTRGMGVLRDAPSTRGSEWTTLRKAAGYGSPGRFAKACSFTGLWVRIPRLPLAPMVKRTSHLASTEAFRVRVLVGALGMTNVEI